MLEYDVAISFAGEQRPEAEAIAECLRRHDVKVFYDKYEAAEIWGKDLYEHLTDVYSRKARYCLMLVSKAYAEKVWTTHERKSAQARAFQERSEYVLPVRFDDTELPGLLPTVGYLRFQSYGVNGICEFLLEKLGKRSSMITEALLAVSTSSRVCFLDGKQELQAYIPVVECTWGSAEANLVLQPDDETDGPYLDGLRGADHLLLVAFRQNVAACRVAEVEHTMKNGLDQWRVRLRLEASDFSPAMEPGFGELSADDLAEERARRILLNERPPAKENIPGESLVSRFNRVTREVLVKGVNTVLQPKDSPFPPLFERYGGEPMKFLDVAWILAVLMLKASGVVVEVTSLQLTVNGSNLAVSFVGKRRRQYVDMPAKQMVVQGTCVLG